jgi:hypothetical protein
MSWAGWFPLAFAGPHSAGTGPKDPSSDTISLETGEHHPLQVSLKMAVLSVFSVFSVFSAFSSVSSVLSRPLLHNLAPALVARHPRWVHYSPRTIGILKAAPTHQPRHSLPLSTIVHSPCLGLTRPCIRRPA